MPIFDFYCKECGEESKDVFLRDSEEEVKCPKCDTPMNKRPPIFSFSMTPGAISKWKKRYGKSLPPEYKTSGGANIYGVPKRT